MELGIDMITIRNFAIAVLIGALVGIEREKKKVASGSVGTIGLRTFILLAQVGAIAAWLSQHFSSPWIFVAGVAVVGAVVIAGYVAGVRKRPDSLGLTTEVAAISVCLLGGAVMLGYPEIAVALAILTSATLAFKQPLHGVVGKLDTDDIYAGLKLLIATFIVLPLLPNRAVDPWGALNPYNLWLLVILISSLSLIGYVAVRWQGARRGTAITGVAGGLVSSTAVTLAFAKQSRENGLLRGSDNALAAGVLLAWAIMFVRVLVEVAVVNSALLPAVMLPLAVLGTVTVITAGIYYWRGSEKGVGAGPPADSVAVQNPFSLTAAGKFALFFAAVLLIVKLVEHYAHPQGMLVVAALAGLTDVDAIALSMAGYARDTGDAETAVMAITIATLTNTLVKCGIVAALATPALRKRILLAMAMLLIAGVTVLLL